MRLFLAVLALVSGGAALWLWVDAPQVQTPVSQVIQQAAEDVPDSVAALVATRSLPAGTRVTETDLEWANLPVRSVPSGAALQALIPDAEARMVGMVLLRDVEQGDAISWSDMATTATTRLSERISENMVAFAIVVSEATAVGGLVRPGDRVDVFQVQRGGPATETTFINIGQDLRVLAADQTIQPSSDVPANPPRTLTLEVDMAQLERLGRAQAEGGLLVTLKPKVDLPRP